MRCRLTNSGTTTTRRFIMSNYTHQTAPTQFVEPNSIRFAYRRFGKTGGVPLVFSQHYIGTMDYWDPTVTDGLARDREVILFNNAGVSSSSGGVPTTFEGMGANAIAFIKALGQKRVDVLGFSIGGMVERHVEELIYGLTLFQGRSSPTMSFPTTPRTVTISEVKDQCYPYSFLSGGTVWPMARVTPSIGRRPPVVYAGACRWRRRSRSSPPARARKSPARPSHRAPRRS